MQSADINRYLDRVQGALSNADKQESKEIDSDNYDTLQTAVSKSSDEINQAVDDS